MKDSNKSLLQKRKYKTIYTQVELVKAIQDYSLFPTRALYHKLCHYREQCLRYLKNNPNDFDKQLDLVDLNHMGIPNKKPPINRGPKPKVDPTSICNGEHFQQRTENENN